jgi:hypothetical protein
VPEYSQNFNRYSYVLNNPLNKTDPTGYSWVSKAFHKIGAWVKENWRTVATIVLASALMLTGAGAFIFGFMYGLAGGTAAGIAAMSTFTLNMAVGATIGGITGAIGAALSGGNLGDVLRGAAVGAVQGAISSGPLHALEGTNGMQLAHIVGHGVTGGAANAAMGGKFQDGFLSAAASAAAVHTGLTSTAAGTTGEAIGMAGRTAASAIIGGTASALGGGKFANGAYTSAFQHLLNSEMVPSRKYTSGSVGANDDGGPDPAIESAFDFGIEKGYLSISENGDLSVSTSFQYVAWREGEFTGTSAKGSNGILTWFHRNDSYSTYTIASGGRAMISAVRGKNSRIPKGAWQPTKHWETLPPFTGKSAPAFMRNGVGFKFAIPTPGTNRSAILFHPTPDGRTSGCIGFCGPNTEMIDFRDRMLNLKGNYPKIITE